MQLVFSKPGQFGVTSTTDASGHAAHQLGADSDAETPCLIPNLEIAGEEGFYNADKRIKHLPDYADGFVHACHAAGYLQARPIDELIP